ncbi:MAG: TonB-dependent receptor [Acidobacteria bacterium]|nr:TonB-dependent receptor [Acidobacteriota bacterium]
MTNVKKILCLTMLLLVSFAVQAQQNTAELSGSVSDANGAVLINTKVTVRQPLTGATRVTHTNSVGIYTFTQLPLGVYSVSVSQTGFQTEVREGVELTVGQRARLDFSLKVGAVSSETVVTAGVSQVETQSSALSSVMDKDSIRELPLNGRDIVQLALLKPGVAPSRRSSDSAGSGVQLTVGGRRPNQISFVLDQTDINDGNNNTPGSVSGVLLGVDTLQEFRVLTNGYSAEYGRSAGGIISAVTRSGTNEWHGSAFEFVRNSAFDAKNFFDPATQKIPHFARNQFGGVASGPIKHDRTFFLASYEGLRQRLGITNQAVVPNAAARNGDIPGLAKITVNPAVPGYLALVPLPNGRDFGDGTGQYISSGSNLDDEDFVAGRVDHRFSDKTSIFGRYTFNNAKVSVPDNLQLFRSATASRNQYVTAQMTRIFNERLLNNVRFSYNRSTSRTTPESLRSIDSALSFFPGQPLGQISITGLFSMGPSRFGPNFNELNLFQVGDDLSWIVGRHSLKLGVDHREIYLPTSRPQSPYGFYQFTSLANFLRATPSSVELALPGSEVVRRWRQSMTAAYIQDDFRLSRRLTVNAGLRYERTSLPHEKDGLEANVRNPLTDKTSTVGDLYKNPSNLNFAPRVGLAWDPFGDGKTSVRASFGVFFDPLWTDFYANAANRTPPFYTLGSVRNPVFPNASAVTSSPNFVLGRQDTLVYEPQNPYSMHTNFSIQREVAKGATLTVAFVRQRGLHEVRLIDQNQAIPTIQADGRKFFPTTSTVRNPNFSGIRHKTTDGQSSYNGLQTTFEYRRNKYLSFHSSYTWSKAIDDGSIVTTQGGDNDLPQDPDSRSAERGLSNFDLRHYFVSYVTTELPHFGGPEWLTAGWQFNAISSFASGNPFSVVVGFDQARARFQAGTSPQRPDLVSGKSNNPILGGPNKYFDTSAFVLPSAGYYGTLGRNTLIGPGLATIDLAANKTFKLGERLNLQFRTEVFNSLNHPNFSIPSQRTVFSSTGAVGSAGLITTTKTSSRQLQFGLKLTF